MSWPLLLSSHAQHKPARPAPAIITRFGCAAEPTGHGQAMSVNSASLRMSRRLAMECDHDFISSTAFEVHVSSSAILRTFPPVALPRPRRTAVLTIAARFSADRRHIVGGGEGGA